MVAESLKDLYIQVTKDYSYIQGIILKDENKEEEQLLIVEPDYIEQKQEMIFSKKENQHYIIGKRGGCWGLKLQNVGKKTLVVRFSKDKEEIANMILRPKQKYFMNNYNIKEKNYFEIQESENTEKTVQETLEEGTFNLHKNEYEIMVFPVERLENHESYKYSLDDFIRKKEKKSLVNFQDSANNLYFNCPDSYLGLNNRFPDCQLDVVDNVDCPLKFGNATSQQNGVRKLYATRGGQAGSAIGQEKRSGNVGVEQGQSLRQGSSIGNFLQDSKHTMHKKSTRRNQESLSTTDIEEQHDQCLKLQFVVIIKKTLEIDVIDSKEKLIDILVDRQVQQQLENQMQEKRKYVQNECIVCTEKPEKVFAKCGHTCTCQICYDEFKKQNEKSCPLCRGVIQGVFSV